MNASLDRFDAYGDYEYIDLDQHPKPIQYHKPLRYRPQGPEQPYVGRPQEPQRRVDYNRPVSTKLENFLILPQ